MTRVDTDVLDPGDVPPHWGNEYQCPAARDAVPPYHHQWEIHELAFKTSVWYCRLCRRIERRTIWGDE